MTLGSDPYRRPAAAQRFAPQECGDLAAGLLTIVIGLAIASFSAVTVLDRLTLFVFDGYQRLQSRQQTGGAVVAVFVLIGDAERAQDPGFLALLAAHGRMITAYRAGDLSGLEAALSELARHDVPELAKLYEIYRERFRELWQSPLAGDWNDIAIAREK